MALLAAGTEAVPRRGGAAWFLLVALGCGVLAAALATRAVSAARREVPVVVARRLVPPLGRIAAADVSLAEVPAAAVPPGALRAVGGAVGRFVRIGLAPGEIVTGAVLDGGLTGVSAADAELAALSGACGGASDASGSTPAPAPAPATPAASPAAQDGAAPGCSDLVALAVPLSADQGFQIVEPGDRVDVAATYGLRAGTVAQVVAEDVPVLDKVSGSAAPGPAIPGGSAGGGGAASGWLVLGLDPDEALRVQLAEASGKVAMLLRPLGAGPESPGVAREVVDVTQLAGGAPPAASVPADAGTLPPDGGGTGGS